MEYEQLTPPQRRQMVVDQLRIAERQHYTERLRRLANSNDEGVQRATTENLGKLETGIAALRQELTDVDEVVAALPPEQQAPPLTPPEGTTGPALGAQVTP